MMQLLDKKGPIGAVVREADQVFSNITRKTATYGSFKRLEWQFFNLIKGQSGVMEAEVYDCLSSIDSGAGIQKTIARFRRDGFVRMETDRMHLSHKGEEVFAEVAQVQEMIKEKSMQNICPEAYDITVETLQKIMNNLREFLP